VWEETHLSVMQKPGIQQKSKQRDKHVFTVTVGLPYKLNKQLTYLYGGLSRSHYKVAFKWKRRIN